MGDESGAGAANRGVGSTSLELATCSAAANCDYSHVLQYNVDSIENAKWGPPANDYLCWATRVEPSYSGGGPKLTVKTAINRDGVSYWHIEGVGRMSCVKQCCFGSNGGSADVRWLSGNFSSSQAGCGSPVDSNAWWADAVTLVQGVDFPQMDHAGGAKDSGRTVGGSQTSPVQLRTDYCGGSNSTARTYANSFFVGVPGGGHLKKTSTQRTLGYGSPTSYKMVPVSQGVCYFERLGGYIDGNVAGQNGTRWVKIEPVWDVDDYYWYFSRSDPYYYPPEATARCYYYNQSQ